MVIAWVEENGKRKYYKRVGTCTRCGLCCRMDSMNPARFQYRNQESIRLTGKPFDPRCEFLYQVEPGFCACSIYSVERRNPKGEIVGHFDARKLMCKRWPESPADARFKRLKNFCGYRFLECDKEGNIFPGQEAELQPGMDIVLETDAPSLAPRPPLELPQTYPLKDDKPPDPLLIYKIREPQEKAPDNGGDPAPGPEKGP